MNQLGGDLEQIFNEQGTAMTMNFTSGKSWYPCTIMNYHGHAMVHGPCLTISIVIFSHLIDLWPVESWWSNWIANSRHLGSKIWAEKYTLVEQSFYHTRYFATGNKNIFDF